MNGFKTLAQLFNIDFDEESFMRFVQEVRQEGTGHKGIIYELEVTEIERENQDIPDDFSLEFIIGNIRDDIEEPELASILVLNSGVICNTQFR